MVSFRTGTVLLAQAVALVSGVVGGPCHPKCWDQDALLVLLRSDVVGDAALPFCSAFLGLPASTTEVTVTPTDTVTVTETSTAHATEVVTTVDSTSTTTVTAAPVVPEPVTKRDAVDYPPWLPATYKSGRVSSACSCLGIPLSVATSTVSDVASTATVTASATVTETTTSTAHTTALATATVTPPTAPVIVTRRAMIQVFRVSTNVPVGWIYMSSGPSITTDPTIATVFGFDVAEGAATASTVRFSPEGYSPAALGFNVPATQRLENFYGGVIADTPTPPGSLPVISGANKYETDIWTINTASKVIEWDWIESDGTHGNVPYLYRVGGRMYPVANVAAFNAATGGASSSKYEISFKYVQI
ncbi:hypothetical protein B0H66DRAFT_604248 [Apodospora peruviana]|uniref:Uncharacterized protein n=1 Tax=Apodospora peruviana TaxID=516989 RepID=A0AAE0I0N6_9PEZI|nr:hypothetical protein B0H66DRAFT_604248 [Apodospora peruviana]